MFDNNKVTRTKYTLYNKRFYLLQENQIRTIKARINKIFNQFFSVQNKREIFLTIQSYKLLRAINLKP
jgi:hypothetical protein